MALFGVFELIWNWLHIIGAVAGLAGGAWAYFARGWHFLALIIIAASLFVMGRADGQRVAANLCRDRALSITLAQRDARIGELQRQHEAAQMLAREAQERAAQAESANAKDRERIATYEQELSKRGDAARCALDESDLERLR